MAQLDVYLTDFGDHLVDVQSNLFDHFDTRIVVPLLDLTVASKPISRLNPIFDVGGRSLVLYPQLALAVPVADLGQPIGSLEQHHFTIMSALDMLLTGY